MKKVYFNRCFTQTAEVIKHLLNNQDHQRFEIYVSNKSQNHYLESVSTFFEIEPATYTPDEYVEYCLAFCIKHEIDIFIPRHLVEYLVNAKDKFEKRGIKVLLIGTSELYETLDNKVRAYQLLEKENLVKIPPYGVATTFQEFFDCYLEIKSKGFSVCIKPVQGIGGTGFKRIREDLTSYDELQLSSATNVSFDTVCHTLRIKDKFEPLMVLGYLEGQEFSIDCLAFEGELIDAIPRAKIDNYSQLIDPRKDLFEIAQKLTKKFGLTNLYNIQVKYHNGEAYLIEINTRMSGGTYKSCLTGINLPYKAISQLLGTPVKSEQHLVTPAIVRNNNTCAIFSA